ncbi:TonB family protein [Mucilaginibacter sp. AW1-3]
MNWMHYLVEANLYMAAFYALYLLFLRSETLYQLNRAYLLLSTLLAFIIPFLQLGILKPVEVLQQHISIGEPASYAMHVLPDTVTATAPKYTLNDYLLFVYAGVAIVLLINLGIRIYLLIALARKGSVTKNASYKVIEMHRGSVAFSFFNNLFIDDRLASSQTILYHEQVHIRQKHSWDIIYLEIVKIINWFNPIVYLIIASIKEVHEFIADEETANLENNNDSYTDFLISNAYGITQNSLTNSFFNKNLLKRRITMLYQKKSGKAARLKYLLALPLIFGLLCVSTLAFTTKTYALVIAPNKMADLSANNISTNGHGDAVLIEDNGSQRNTQILHMQTKPGAPVYTAVEIQPEFPGGETGLGKFLQKNIHYPATDKQNHVQGKVYIQFIVEPNGGLSSFKVLRSPSDAMSKESVRVMKLSPKWKPGKQNGKPVRVQFTLPINFSLADELPPPPPPAKAGQKLAPPPPPPGAKSGDKLAPPPPPAQKLGPPPPPPAAKSGEKLAPPPPAPDKSPNAVYTAVEIQPEFPGGEAGLTKFLQKNIRYPLEAKEGKIQGKVYVQFVVEKDGDLSDIKVIREPGSGTGDESVRVLKLSPKWTPGKQDGQPVRVQFTLPINFSLGGETSTRFNQMKGYLKTKLYYPVVAKQNGISGHAVVTFTIDDKHLIQSVAILKNQNADMDNIVVDALKSYQKPTDLDAGTYAVSCSFTIQGQFDEGKINISMGTYHPNN